MANGHIQQVWLELCGPRTLLPENVLIFTELDQTWVELFRRELGVLIPLGYRIRSSQFRRSQANGQGHTVSRTAQVRQFVQGFRSRLGLYKATLYNPNERRGRRARRPNPPQVNQPIINIQARAQERLRNFSNRFLQRTRAEIQALRRDGSWIRNVQRAPLSSYLIEELLRGN